MKNRNSSFELLKIIAIFFICLSSSLPYGAMYQGGYEGVYVNLNSVSDVTTAEGGVLLTLFRWLGQVGDTLFLMCSAWFLSNSKKAKSSKYLKLVLDSFVISIIGFFIASLFITPSVKEILRSIFPIMFENNWFVGCYIIYYVIHPLLNNAVRDFEKRQYTIFVTVLVIVYSVIATVLQRYYFTNLVAFIMIHFLVSYCKKYELWNHEKKYDIITIFASSALLLVMIVGMQFVSNKIGILKNRNLLLCHFYNPVILCLVLAALFLAVRTNLKSEHVNAISSLSLFIYLIHGNYFWQAYGKYAVTRMIMDIGMSRLFAYAILFMCVTVGATLLAGIYSLTIGTITGRIVKLIEKYF